MTKITLAEQVKRRNDALDFLTSRFPLHHIPLQVALAKHFILKNENGKQFIPFLPIKIDYKENGDFDTKKAMSNLTLEQIEKVKLDGSCDVEKKDGTKYTYYPLKSSEATHYELRLNFGRQKMVIDIDGYKTSGDIVMSEYFTKDIPTKIQNAPFFLSRTKSLPHHIFYLEGLPDYIKPDKYVNVFKDFNGDILLNHAWELNNSKMYNCPDQEIPTLHWDEVKEWLNPNAQPVKDHNLLGSNSKIFASKLEETPEKQKKVKKEKVVKEKVVEEKEDATDDDEESIETKDLEEKCKTIKKYVNAILEEDDTYFDEYEEWMLLGFICNNETDGEDEGLDCFIELSKLFKTDSGKKHLEKAVKKQYYSTQKNREKTGKKSGKIGIGSLHKWLKELNPEHELLKANNSKLAERGELTADEVRQTESYKKYRTEFEKDYFKLMTPVRYVRIIEGKKGKVIHFYTEKEFFTLTRDEEGMPTFFVKGGLGAIPKKFSELWLDDECKRKFSQLKFDPLEIPNLENAKKKDCDFNTFAGFVNKDLGIEPMSKKEFAETGLGKLFDYLFVEEIVNEYIKCWFAHILRNPNIKTKVAIVLFSKTHGCGKNTIVDYFIKILGRLLCGQVECIDDITKNFNAHLCNKLLIYGDEINANAKKIADRLKQVITRPSQNLEKKNIDAVEVDDFTNWIFTTNNENCFKIEEGDRRFLMVRCKEKRQTEISALCYEEMSNNDLVKQMFSYFYNYKQDESSIAKFGKFNIGSDKVIDTKYKLDLLYENKPAYIQAFFKEPELFANYTKKATELYEITQQYAKKHFLSSNYTSTEFGTAISKFFNEENGIKKRGNSGYKYVFPTKIELLKILWDNDEKYYRYVNQLADDFIPAFTPPKEVEKTDWKGQKYMDVEEED